MPKLLPFVYNGPEKHRQLAVAVYHAFGEEKPDKISITNCHNSMRILTSRMYSYLPLTYKIMKNLAEVFGTEDYTTNQEHLTGCETCDYGSSYSHDFTYSIERE